MDLQHFPTGNEQGGDDDTRREGGRHAPDEHAKQAPHSSQTIRHDEARAA